jgi:hypothetical protein
MNKCSKYLLVEAINRNKLEANSASRKSYYIDIVNILSGRCGDKMSNYVIAESEIGCVNVAS